MAAHSEHSADDWNRYQPQRRRDNQNVSPPPGPASRVDSVDVKGSGGQFSDFDDSVSYPPLLDLSEDDSMRLPQPSTQGQPSTVGYTQTVGGFAGGHLLPGTMPPVPVTSTMETYLMSTPFLPTSDLPEFYRRRGGRLSRSRRTQSSAHDTESSEYLSGKDHRLWSETEPTQDDDEDDERDSVHQQQQHHAAPSHTPSDESQDTVEQGDVTAEGTQAGSPHNDRSSAYSHE